jgi:hypothetical protein
MKPRRCLGCELLECRRLVFRFVLPQSKDRRGCGVYDPAERFFTPDRISSRCGPAGLVERGAT